MILLVFFILIIGVVIYYSIDGYKWQKKGDHNFPFTWKGREYWYSRSMATAGFVFKKINNEWAILANQRGKGTPDFQGYWNAPCGYLEFDVTLAENCAKEIYEETGLSVDPSSLQLVGINDDPKDSNHQNVTARFMAVLDESTEINLNTEHSEKNEVSELKFIPVSKIDEYQWAFGHGEIIKSLATRLEVENNTDKQTKKKKK